MVSVPLHSSPKSWTLGMTKSDESRARRRAIRAWLSEIARRNPQAYRELVEGYYERQRLKHLEERADGIREWLRLWRERRGGDDVSRGRDR